MFRPLLDLRCPKTARPCGANTCPSQNGKTLHFRAMFGPWDVESMHAVVAQSTFPPNTITTATNTRPHSWEQFATAFDMGGKNGDYRCFPGSPKFLLKFSHVIFLWHVKKWINPCPLGKRTTPMSCVLQLDEGWPESVAEHSERCKHEGLLACKISLETWVLKAGERKLPMAAN